MLIKTILLEITEKGDKINSLLNLLKVLIKGTEFENKVFVAGGFVRDKVMGIESKDIDFVVSIPNGGIKFANFITKKTNSYSEGSNPVIFERFGTAKFNIRQKINGIDFSDLELESVMTRNETYDPNSRKPEVAFGSIDQDVIRRDLTINSLLLNVSDGKILDLTGKGLNDIENKIIRTPTDPNETFTDDPLRMLRAIRFSVRYGWGLSNEVFEGIKNNHNQLQKISKERIRDEFDKILVSKNPKQGILMLMNTGLMKYIIPEMYNIKDLTQNQYHQYDVLNHTLLVVQNTPPKLDVRLSALLHDIGKYETKTDIDGKIQFLGHEDVGEKLSIDILRRLKYPNNIIKKVSTLIKHHMRTKPFGDDVNITDKPLRKLMNDLNDDLEDFLDLVHSDNISHGDPGWEHNMENQVANIKNKLEQIRNRKEPEKMKITGKDVMDTLNIKPGPKVGSMLKKLNDIYLDNPDKINNMSDEEVVNLILSLKD